MGKMNPKYLSRLKRKARIRKKIRGSGERPRLTVFRSARHMYAQIIDDEKGVTLVAASTLDKEFKAQQVSGGKMAAAALVGKLVGQRAKEKGIERVVFDRNGYMYHGRVKAVSDGAREAGLEF